MGISVSRSPTCLALLCSSVQLGMKRSPKLSHTYLAGVETWLQAHRKWLRYQTLILCIPRFSSSKRCSATTSSRGSVTDTFNAHAQGWIKHAAWVGSCRSWYKSNYTRRVNAVWSGSSNHYQYVIKMLH